MKLETKRKVATISLAQFWVVLFIFMTFGEEGMVAASIMIPSFLISLLSYSWIRYLSRLSKCPACDRTYFMSNPIFFVIPKRCVSCGVKEGDPPGSYWRGL